AAAVDSRSFTFFQSSPLCCDTWASLSRLSALLDTASGALSLERLAQVSQQSGEDWKNVKLRLSTAAATEATGPRPLQPWTLTIRPPAPPAAPAPAAARAAELQGIVVTGMRAKTAEAIEKFDLGVFEGTHATEFVLPTRVNIDSSTQRANLSLGSEKLQARVLVRAHPRDGAFVMTEADKPAGSWPSGEVQLMRDGNFVGRSELDLASSEERLELPFGRDELVRVQAEPEQRNAGSTGFIGTRAERRYTRAWVVENRHKSAVTLQLIEAAPVSQHEDIKVQATFSPVPTTQAWRKQPGLVLWELPLAAGQSQRFTAEYVISAPKEAQVTGLR
ncbi:MAG: mucoidy inhibitor MuiA family protein, partial [Rubrivivax sp.]